jgi:hydrogenase maturation protein HypF
MVLVRREYLLRGVVQGVGFRPHVAVVAARHPITGFVGNDDRQVFIEAEGDADALDVFIDDLLATLPPLARVIAMSSHDLPLAGEPGFRIVASRRLPGVRTLIPPDVATCDDCLADMADPNDRRYGYPFTTCTNCGPRLTIIEDLPYDRPATTMRGFGMCPACRAEYADPDDRRYHAQPISCPDCGPVLWLARPGDDAAARPFAGPASPEQQAGVIAEARRRLAAGEILAVKGLGGFHLMCDARSPAAVGRLRERKRRSGKPFAVMVCDASAAAELARLSEAQLAVLRSPARPILIAPMSPGYDLADDVAPGLVDVGLMLPYTPLHTLLLDGGDALIATSGNMSEEPLCFTNADALDRLAHLVDGFLLHDRDIHVPVEDSVLLTQPAASMPADAGSGTARAVRAADPLAAPDTLPVRRSRGFAPLPVLLPGADAGDPVVLAVGGELKNTFALAVDDMAFVSAHVGDMGSLASQQAFERSVGQLLGIHRSQPEIVSCDLHPDYATTAWAERYAEAHPGVRLVQVQHHYAHALSLLAEHGIADGPVVVAALDGTGYGPDGTIWGGEVLTLTGGSAWQRSWHVPTFALVGGDRAIRHPWRIAQGLAHSWGLDISGTPAAVDSPDAERRLVASQLESGFGVVATSSSGRLFDAASAILGLCLDATYEAHAALALERAAAAAPPIRLDAGFDDPADVFTDLVAHPERRVDERALRFHLGLASVFAARVDDCARAAGTRTVGLTGGVAVNRVFSGAFVSALKTRGCTVLTHRVVPPTDGGLSLGQVWAGRLLAGT